MCKWELSAMKFWEESIDSPRYPLVMCTSCHLQAGTNEEEAREGEGGGWGVYIRAVAWYSGA